jgi:hypothetical protein
VSPQSTPLPHITQHPIKKNRKKKNKTPKKIFSIPVLTLILTSFSEKSETTNVGPLEKGKGTKYRKNFG